MVVVIVEGMGGVEMGVDMGIEMGVDMGMADSVLDDSHSSFTFSILKETTSSNVSGTSLTLK